MNRAEFIKLIIAVIFVAIAFFVAIFLIIRPYHQKQQAIKKTASISKVLVIKHCKKEILSKKDGIVKYIKRCQIIKKNESIAVPAVPVKLK